MNFNFRQLNRTWIVAEIGVNHEGDANVARSLIDAAAQAGADAVKFQTYQPEGYVSTVQPERLDRVRRFALSHTDFRMLASHARMRGITFFSTPLSLLDADFLDEIVPVFKVASGELTFLDLIRHIAEKGKPMIVSTGLGLKHEIQAAVDTILSVRPKAREDGSLILMHCVSAYPAPSTEANLRNIRWLIDTFGLPVGYSDHTLGIKACELAVAAGAVALEKHFTDVKEGRAFRDHQLSADPPEFGRLIAAVREAEQYLGMYERQRGHAETENLLPARRSVAAAVDIAAGEVLDRRMLTCLRPMWGIPSEQIGTVVGRKTTRAIKAGDLIRPECIEQ